MPPSEHAEVRHFNPPAVPEYPLRPNPDNLTFSTKDAIEFNSLPALERLLPGGDLNQMHVHVKLGVPKPFMDAVQQARVQAQFPYGNVLVQIVEGGLCCRSGVVLAEQGDAAGDDRAIVVVAAVSVLC